MFEKSNQTTGTSFGFFTLYIGVYVFKETELVKLNEQWGIRFKENQLDLWFLPNAVGQCQGNNVFFHSSLD